MPELSRLCDIVTTLRSPEGCPWDRAQTLTSLTPGIIEEAYELVDALESGNMPHIIEECGDVLLQVVMISRIASETKLFDLGTVATAASDKMIRRHPHVFADKTVSNVSEVLVEWESIKDLEKTTQGIMDDLPKLPALLRAQKIQKRASKVGFDWPDTAGAWEKVDEELNEFKNELKGQDKPKIEEEAGDLLFALVNVLRKENINAEEAYEKRIKNLLSGIKKWKIYHQNLQT